MNGKPSAIEDGDQAAPDDVSYRSAVIAGGRGGLVESLYGQRMGALSLPGEVVHEECSKHGRVSGGILHCIAKELVCVQDEDREHWKEHWRHEHSKARGASRGEM
jgi:hypothetical protein